MITAADLGGGWTIDADGVAWSWYYGVRLAGEHQWANNSCPSCLGCVYGGCTVHEACDCLIFQDEAA